MLDDFKEEGLDTLKFLYRLLLDAILLLFIAFLAKTVKYILENYCYHKRLEDIENKTVYLVYQISEYTVVILFFIFVATHIISAIRKLFKDNFK